MQSSFRTIFINSSLAFVSAFIITTIIHELGHFILYFIFGAQPVLHHNFVQTLNQNISSSALVISALAGPVISLIQGIILGAYLIRKPGNSDKYLLILWLCLLGFINFFGYLMLTPISKNGDTGKVAEMLGISPLIKIIIAVIGLLLLILIVIKMGKYFTNFIPANTDKTKKGKYINSMMMFPIMVGSVVNILLAFPIPVILSVIYPATSSYVILTSYGSILKVQNKLTNESEVDKKVSVFLVAVTISTILTNRLLTMGFG
jgi:hypothetical protein